MWSDWLRAKPSQYLDFLLVEQIGACYGSGGDQKEHPAVDPID